MRNEIKGLSEKQLCLSLIIRNEIRNPTVRRELTSTLRELQKLYEERIDSLDSDLFVAQMGEHPKLPAGPTHPDILMLMSGEAQVVWEKNPHSAACEIEPCQLQSYCTGFVYKLDGYWRNIDGTLHFCMLKLGHGMKTISTNEE